MKGGSTTEMVQVTLNSRFPSAAIQKVFMELNKYEIGLSEWNPDHYFDEASFYKEAYFKEKKKNEELNEEIEELKNSQAITPKDFNRISENVAFISSKMKEFDDLKKQVQTKEIITTRLLNEYRKTEKLKEFINCFLSDLEKTLEWPIKLDKWIDPVITPSGVTYDRIWIERHLVKNKIDPWTKKRLTKKHLIPNRNIKSLLEVISKFKYTFNEENRREIMQKNYEKIKEESIEQ